MRFWIAPFLSTLLLAGATSSSAETITANATRLGGASVTDRFTVSLERYSTDEERAHWRAIFVAGGQDALVEAWQEEGAKVGSCRFSATTGYDIRAAAVIPTDKGRKIVIATDRPFAGYEVSRNLRSEDYPIGWIELEVDAEGKGEGRIYPLAAFTMENGELTMTTYGTEPVLLRSVVVKPD
jgi:hypothetical protein